MVSVDGDIDYGEILTEFVDEEYVNMIDEEGLEAAAEYSEIGGTASVCVAVGLTQSENVEWGTERIADELGVTRRGIYNARDELDLVEKETRGRHVE